MPDKPEAGKRRYCVAFESISPAAKRQIISPVRLMPAHFSGENVKCFDAEYKALWDTGAQASHISESLASSLNLPKVGQQAVQGVGGVSSANTYLAGLELPNRGIIPHIILIGFIGTENFDVLIGMDIILKGDFLISSEANTVHFSYQQPSFGGFFLKDILNVKLHNGLIASPEWYTRELNPRIGRNDPCPCGSGKKYKKCCGKHK